MIPKAFLFLFFFLSVYHCFHEVFETLTLNSYGLHWQLWVMMVVMVSLISCRLLYSELSK